VKKYYIYILFILSITFTTNSYSQKIAYANLDLIINSSDVGKKIISYFSSKNDKLILEVKEKKIEINESEKKLISQKNILDDNEYNKKINILKKQIEDFNKISSEKKNQLNLEKNKNNKNSLIEINKILRDYAEGNNIDIIFSSNQMLIGKSNLDVTQNILNEVNKNITNFKINKYE